MIALLLSACDGGPANGRRPNIGGYSGFNSGFRGMSANYGGYEAEQRYRGGPCGTGGALLNLSTVAVLLGTD